MLLRPSLKNFLSKARKIFLLALSTGIFFYSMVFVSGYFNVTKIEITGLGKDSSILGIDEYKNKNIFIISEKKIEKTIVKKNSFVKSVTVSKVLPNKLVIDIDNYKILATLKANLGYLYLSDDSRVLFKKKELLKKTTVINFYQKTDYATISPGSWINYRDIVFSLEMLKNCINLGLAIDSIDIQTPNMIGFNLKDKKLFFSREKNQARQIYELSKIIKQFAIEGRIFKSLDLRFDKPVFIE